MIPPLGEYKAERKCIYFYWKTSGVPECGNDYVGLKREGREVSVISQIEQIVSFLLERLLFGPIEICSLLLWQ